MERWMPLAIIGVVFAALFIGQTVVGLRRSAAFQRRVLEDSERGRAEGKALAEASRNSQERLLEQQIAVLDRIATALEQRKT